MEKSAKAQADSIIARKLLALPEYQAAKTVLCYVSMPQEVDTAAVIAQALADGKRVAAPKCLPGRKLVFRLVSDTSQWQINRFGVKEPEDACPKLVDFSGAVCIVPGLAFDSNGNRLGFGGGYYDRFLAGFPGCKIGLCYHICVEKTLPVTATDIPMDIVIHD